MFLYPPNVVSPGILKGILALPIEMDSHEYFRILERTFSFYRKMELRGTIYVIFSLKKSENIHGGPFL